ncbi:MAG: 4-hydroxythreonine-4-phosphate dehydrogenase PdxA [Candidatus Omnitrophota bacterium]
MPISRSAKVHLAVTLGDPAGIGPEVALKAIHSWKKRSQARILLIGPAAFYRDLARKMGLRLSFLELRDLSGWKDSPALLSCYFFGEVPRVLARGRSDKRLSKLAMRSIDLALELAMKKEVDAVVTAPVNKAALREAGFNIPGHTEYLARRSRTRRFEMMLVGGKLRVVVVTRHIALKNVPKALTRKNIEEAILLTDEALRRWFGVKKPRIVVCGLNPHAGEKGNFGREEIEKIGPAVRSARKKTRSVITGPLSPDALFVDAYAGKYDAEICMYHDQGLIPLKMIARGSGVNVTLGLPFVRTSPDHGTAYDIAGKFTADAGSMREALELAAHLAKNRKRNAGPRSRD